MEKIYQALFAHVKAFWPNNNVEKFKWDLGRINQELPNFSVLRVTPNNNQEPWVYITHGSWEIDKKSYRYEFFILSPFETPSHIETLAMLTSFHYDKKSDLNVGKAVDIGRGWMDTSSYKHLLVSLPYPYGPEFETCHVSNSLEVKYLWLLPISIQENQYLKENGLEALESRFDIIGIDYLDPNRPSVI